MDRKILFPLLAIGIVLVSGCISGEIPSVDTWEYNITESAREWLATTEGQEAYPNGVPGKPAAIHNENKEAYLWIVPVMNQDRLYTGYITYDNDDFIAPKSYTQYGEPYDSFFSSTKDIAYSAFITDNPSYLPEQIKEPVLVVRKYQGIYWMSEVVVNGEIVDVLYEKTFID